MGSAAMSACIKGATAGFLIALATVVSADSASPAISSTGPTGCIRVPDASVIPLYHWGMSGVYENYGNDGAGDGNVVNSLSVLYGAFDNTEIGIRAYTGSQNMYVPSPRISLKYKLPGSYHRLGRPAAGMLYDTGSDNFLTLYMMAGPFGFGFNLYGCTETGKAALGGYNHVTGIDPVSGATVVTRTNPHSAFLLFGHEIPLGNTGASILMEYDGDAWGGGLRYRYGRVFSFDVSTHQRSSRWRMEHTDNSGVAQEALRWNFGFIWGAW